MEHRPGYTKTLTKNQSNQRPEATPVSLLGHHTASRLATMLAHTPQILAAFQDLG